ncbi:MAG TPA: SipW-dependent-type signal peptide-containing protein [Candidatus Fusicatenibacter intestinigallinarum]|uniref:SipW-dependent-type signal peptide-containing protein n=1 Tax=Candidatus Fusicatenibacter intestinigallinarum TaxID=2838598 RepID=A0A9D2SP09_9FIRM|nr:SipW-dependent-type signal peptide-containing protein [Candidatus Fusicatenibacter intestinigallinarum]
MKKRRTAAMIGAGILCTLLTVGSTVAYLTDKDEVVNQFTVGRVEIEGKEPSYTPDPGGKTEDIVPTEVIPKDPQITNTGKNDAYVYVDVSIPIAKVITVDAQGKRLNGGSAAETELFTMNEVSSRWTLMYQKRTGDSMIYTYSYNEILAPQKTTLPLFQSVTFANIVEGQLEEKQLEVPVNFYAIQALNTGEGTNVVQQAADAWLKYVNQNDGQAGAAAASLSDVQTLQNEAGETPESEDSTGQNEEAEAAEQNEEAEAAEQEES